jgi:putative membrane protein
MEQVSSTTAAAGTARTAGGLHVPALCLAAFLLVWAALAIAPLDRPAWALENLLTAVGVPIAVASFRRFRFSDRAYLQTTLFLTLHTIGSHYTYSRTPLGNWARDLFDLQRNHYDRFVHFAFGVLMFLPCRELFFRVPAVMPRARQLGLAFALIAAISAGYEIVEWLTEIVADPDAGTAFLGTQGDDWDAQKDSLCACAGAVLGVVIDRRARPQG